MAHPIFISRLWQLKNIILPVLLLMVSFGIQAERRLEHGVLQAYWKAQWSDNAAINVPALGFRYYWLDDQGKLKKVINIYVKATLKEQLLFIRQNFSDIPENFIKFREWYVNQQGSLLVNNIAQYTECSSENYSAVLLSFVPVQNKPASNIDDMNAQVPCGGDGRYPWLTTYHLQHEWNQLSFKEWPDDNANNTYSVMADDVVVKIRTINKYWIYAALYDDSKADRMSEKRGYIRRGHLKPDN
ncbi:hypothetical protein ACU6Z1_14640 [Klebsiella aerogenes]|uniref:hypothetical protein n=1 Tax=Klebsiella aerogenes TaxID=548 RepID=UPI001F18E7C1|nr:hypothetical protein [Klebsiella aerogenes]WPS03754.1 hypothetical protein SM908_00715 [Klebsiella aerogenes]HCR0414995.1 hypothetical protein [Klebsiella aerogenes]HCT4453773.1 hypothetical protein [Klebsiella aerogenes]HDU4639547.1 hypothetical protein [Klebsiella aerogenes]